MATGRDLGQYFTKNVALQSKVCQWILNKPTCILEPSVGRGDLVMAVIQTVPKATFDMFDKYEIDTTIKMLDGITGVIFGDFLTQKIDKKYKTIIGNPPYVRTKSGNLYIDFIDKCVKLLEDDGELVFIVPADLFQLTSAARVLDSMMQAGTFTHVWHPHNEKMFENATIDVVVFRYQKSPNLAKKAVYNGRKLNVINNNGLITFSDALPQAKQMFNSIFDIYVGLVSGKDEVFKTQLGNIQVLTGENKLDKYILVEKFPSGNADIDAHLTAHKAELTTRKIRKFNAKNWFEWGALRNINVMREHAGKDCIYVYNLTRRPVIAFVGKVGYFGGGLIMLLPKLGVDLAQIAAQLNSVEFKSNFLFAGRFKIGHHALSNSQILF